MKRVFTISSQEEPTVMFGIKCRPWRSAHGFEGDEGKRCYCGMYRLVSFRNGPRVKPDLRPIGPWAKGKKKKSGPADQQGQHPKGQAQRHQVDPGAHTEAGQNETNESQD